jgi:hypothetical protein
MKQLFEPCGGYSEGLCLLASGVLRRDKSARLESHLAGCDECRRYYEELSGVAGPLAKWEENFADVEPSSASQARWARDFAKASEPTRPAWIEFVFWSLDWCKAMVWPCRRIWAGLATVWLVLLGVNVTQQDPGRIEAMKSRPSPEMVRAYLAQERFLDEFSRPARRPEVKPPKPPATEPRSERRRSHVLA